MKKIHYQIYINNKVCNSKSPQNGVHRFEQPYLHQLCSDVHDLGLIQRRNEFPFWKCICLAIFLQMLGQLLRNNTIHNTHDPVDSDHVFFMNEISSCKDTPPHWTNEITRMFKMSVS